MALFDATIFITYLIFASVYEAERFPLLLVIMLFFLAFRIISLSFSKWFSILNVMGILILWDDGGWLLLLLYLPYVLVYLHLKKLDEEKQAVVSINDELIIRNNRHERYKLLEANYRDQLVQNLKLEERNRISQEIHDLLGHSMVAAILQLEAANMLLTEDPEQASKLLTQSTDLLRRGTERIRKTVREIKVSPKKLKLQGLELFLTEARKDTSLPIHFEFLGSEEAIELEYWPVIYQIVSESISNIVRHAKATQVDISLQVFTKIIKLSVQDNGVGGSEIQEGMGIRSMREGAQSVGAIFTVDGSKGFLINVLFKRKEVS